LHPHAVRLGVLSVIIAIVFPIVVRASVLRVLRSILD
jgi:hypothetical protein